MAPDYTLSPCRASLLSQHSQRSWGICGPERPLQAPMVPLPRFSFYLANPHRACLPHAPRLSHSISTTSRLSSYPIHRLCSQCVWPPRTSRPVNWQYPNSDGKFIVATSLHLPSIAQDDCPFLSP